MIRIFFASLLIMGFSLTALAYISIDEAENELRIFIRFPQTNTEMELSSPVVTESNVSDKCVEWVYPEVQLPGGGAFIIKRRVFKDRESLIICPLTTIEKDVEIIRQCKIRQPVDGEVKMTLPLRNGWAKSIVLENSIHAQYWLGTRLADSVPELAIPMTEIVFSDSSRLAIMSDPYLGTLFSAQKEEAGILLKQRFLYDCQNVPIEDDQTRTFATWIQPSGEKATLFEESVDVFFRMILDDVPPGPQWLHDIAMVSYDYLSDGGDGWTNDLLKLAEILSPEERARVACCYHGRYADLCNYMFDRETGTIKSQWSAMARTRNVPFTIARVKKELQLAKSLGFRVCLYFADGLMQDSGHPEYRPDWNFVILTNPNPPGTSSPVNEEGHLNGWTGPDTWGKTIAKDPGNPEVADWYSTYLNALLQTFGEDIDAIVWDETFHISQGYIGTSPKRTHSDVAMMQLVKRLTKQVTDFDPEKAFLVSDAIGAFSFLLKAPAYSMVSHGTYQDSQCMPSAWSYAMFPNWQNTFWSCNWGSIKNFERMKFGVEHFGAPVAISNGWEDDTGPSEWTTSQQEKFIQLFRERCKLQQRPRFLKVDSAVILQQLKK